MTYKYGCSDARFHQLGGMQLLMWKAIQEAKRDGLQEFDMGRTEWDNEGLLRYKDRWGGTRSMLTSFRHPATEPKALVQTFRIVGPTIFNLAPDHF